MPNYLTVVPAYGRDYKSAKMVRADWAAGKDFRICDISCKDDGRYCNKQDLEREGWTGTVMIRYKQLRHLCAVKM